LDIALIQELGLPVAGTIGLAWFALKLVNWGKEHLLNEINEVKEEINKLESITIKLIDNEKKNEITLQEIASNLEVMIKIMK
tara:strand:- start:729 stop:974 length:246 start_codon:yes stop_codon:yes gene_type:complete